MSQATTALRLSLQGVTPPLSRSDHSKQGGSHSVVITSPREAESNNIYILGIYLILLSKAIHSMCSSSVCFSSYSKSAQQEEVRRSRVRERERHLTIVSRHLLLQIAESTHEKLLYFHFYIIIILLSVVLTFL